IRYPHSGGESFSTDVAESEHHSFIGLFDREKVTGQVTHREDLARDVECAVTNQARRTQTTMHLRGLGDSATVSAVAVINVSPSVGAALRGRPALPQKSVFNVT